MRLLISLLSVLLGSVVTAFAEGNQDTVTVDDRAVPVVERLMGDFPVGRWQCWAEHRDLDVWGDSNKWFRPPGCNIVLHADASVVEFLPDSKGYILGIRSERGTSFDYDESKAFAIAGIRDALFSRVTEIRWSISDPGGWKSCNDLRAQGCLTLTTTRHERFSMVKVQPDVIRFTDDYYGTKRLLFRVGSRAHRAMREFGDCVANNKGVALFNVVTCDNPLEVR